jgi:putative DNA primase/helicase
VAPAFSDEALAQQFADIHANELRYVPEWNKWYGYDGKVWAQDKTLIHYRCARKICRQAAAGCNDNKARTLASAKTVNAVATLARADLRIAATTDQWDADPWLLNTPGGVVNLATGKLHQHHPELYLSKITNVTPDFQCETPLWTAFLKTITANDEELIAFLARMAGLCLTGIISEECLFFLHGSGANGKGTFTGALIGCLGDGYHCTAPSGMFEESRHQRHRTEIARLKGARLVTAHETGPDKHWDEQKIKELTGGDRISANFMRQDLFEFDPTHKLMISGNEKPSLRNVNEAIRRRLHLVPFNVTIAKEKRDPELKEKLKNEYPGILAWMIRGCLDWQQGGLRPPAAVIAATAEYLSSEDRTAEWLAERCDLDPDGFESKADLFDDWRQWARKNGYAVGTKNALTTRLKAPGTGLYDKSNGVARGLSGIRFKLEVQAERDAKAANNKAWWNDDR